MFQIVVSVLPKVFDPFGGPVTNRPHQWVSASGEDFHVIMASLRKSAVRDMKMTDAELDIMERQALNAWTHELKNSVMEFTSDEYLSVAIFNEADIAQREADLNALLGIGKETVH